MIWFLLLICIGIIFALVIYLYDGSQFKKITNYSLLQVIFNRNIQGTYNLFRGLSKINKKGKILLNVKLPTSDMINAIVILPSGIYVIDMKNTNGWLYGHEESDEWTLVMFKEKVITLQNPIITIANNVNAVQKQLSLKNLELYHSLIVFSDNTVFKKLSIQKNNVLNIRDLKNFFDNENMQLLSETEIEKIYKSLEPFMTTFTDFKQVKKDEIMTSSEV